MSLSHRDQVILLLFADDLVLLAYSRHDAQRKLNVLNDYCKDNGLVINPDKSKVIVFRL